MRTPIIYLLFLSLLAGLSAACTDDAVSTSPDDRLSYSTDTVRFDTLFTTVSSSTERLMVYNTHSKRISIESIELLGGGTSGFRINVDGMQGTRFEQIDIARRDSLFIFVEATIDPTGFDLPQRCEDIIELRYNGLIERITLEAYGQDAIFWRGRRIEADTTITAAKPVVVYDSLCVATGVTLTRAPGSRLCFHDKGKLVVEGTLRAEGTFDNPVTLRGDRPDKLFSNLPYDNMSAQWGGVCLRAGSFDNLLSHTHLRGTTYGITADSCGTECEKLRIESCVIKNSNGPLLAAVGARIEAANSEFSNGGGPLLQLEGGSYGFTHCTIASLTPFVAVSDAAVSLSNRYYSASLGVDVSIPLERADFLNCLIWGRRTAEVSLTNYQPAGTEEFSFNHLFDHCLIKASGEDDENFVSTLWGDDPLFLLIDADNYTYNFTLQPDSPAARQGNPDHAAAWPLDLNGRPRNQFAPSIGAYEPAE